MDELLIGLDLSACVDIWFGSQLFCIFSYTMYFLEFWTPTQNNEVRIHYGHMDIGLSEKIKYCARKIVEKTHFVPPCKINYCRMWRKTFPRKMWVRDTGVPQDHKKKVSALSMINRRKLKSKNHQFLRLQKGSVCQ